jgi:hypothetical protein
VWYVMQNEETYVSNGSNLTQPLKLWRKRHFVECLSKVVVSINGVEVAALKNGEEIVLSVQAESTIELDLQSPAWHNYYKVEIKDLPVIEFCFRWFGTGSIFKHNNIRLLRHSGCRITETGRKLTPLQQMDNKMSFWFIGILVAALIVLLILKYCFGISI